MRQRPRAILFDLDNTLHDRDAGLLAFIRAQHADLKFASSGIPLDAWSRRFVELDAGGKVWKDAVYRQPCEEFGLSAPAESLLAAYVAGFADHVRPNGDLPAIFRRLRDEDWRLGIVSNGRSGFQRSTLAASGISAWIDLVVISEEVKMRKPDAAIFHHALTELGCEARDSWFVGDDPIADIGGASAIGMRTLLIPTDVRLGGVPDVVGSGKA